MIHDTQTKQHPYHLKIRVIHRILQFMKSLFIIVEIRKGRQNVASVGFRSRVLLLCTCL